MRKGRFMMEAHDLAEIFPSWDSIIQLLYDERTPSAFLEDPMDKVIKKAIKDNGFYDRHLFVTPCSNACKLYITKRAKMRVVRVRTKSRVPVPLTRNHREEGSEWLRLGANELPHGMVRLRGRGDRPPGMFPALGPPTPYFGAGPNDWVDVEPEKIPDAINKHGLLFRGISGEVSTVYGYSVGTDNCPCKEDD